jgi:hypothetical protein
LQTADPGVDLTQRDVSTCNNPTFIPGHPDQNYLAKIAPQPTACDKVGAGPCTGNEGTYNVTPGGSSSGSKSSSASKTPASKPTSTGGAKHGESSDSATPTAAATGPLPVATGASSKPVGAHTSGAVATAQDPNGAVVLAGGGDPTTDDPNAANQTPVATVVSVDDHSSATLVLSVLAAGLFVAALVVPSLALHRTGRRRR